MNEPSDISCIKPSSKSSATFRAVDLLVFLIPALQFVRVRLVGVLNGSDMAIFLVFLVLLARGKLRIQVPLAKKLLVFCSLWLLSQIVTDVIRHTAFADFARGWSNIGLTLIDITTLFTLVYGRPKRIVLYGWGMVVGNSFSALFNPDELTLYDPWKFGWSYPATLALLLIASRKDVRGYWPGVLAIVVGMLNVFMGIRSRGGLCIAAGIYLLVVRALRRRGIVAYRLTIWKIVPIAVCTLVAGVGIYTAYQHFVSTGMLGEDARKKYEDQTSGRFGLLLGGRSELLSSIPAIINSPIIGHGSWAKDPVYLLAEQQALAMLGYEGAGKISPEQLQEGLIPTHSYLFFSWVDAGIIGALFWVWVWVIVAKTLIRSYPQNILIPPPVPWFALELLWAILFSPYGGEVRITFSYYMVILIGYLSIPAQEDVKASRAQAFKRLRTA